MAICGPIFVETRLRCPRPRRPFRYFVIMRRLVGVMATIRVKIADDAVDVIALAQDGRVPSRHWLFLGLDYRILWVSMVSNLALVYNGN